MTDLTEALREIRERAEAGTPLTRDPHFDARDTIDTLLTALEAAVEVLAEVETKPGLHRITIGRMLRGAITEALTTKEARQ